MINKYRDNLDWMRIDAISVERGGFLEESVDGLSGRDADQGANSTRMEFFHLGFQFLRLVQHQIDFRDVAR